jgi:xanthine dehydrogenase accessory factor
LLSLRGQRSGDSRKRGGPLVTDWIDDLARLREQHEPAVLVTVASTKGSAPREAGTKMIVTREHVYGTIGGGHLELQAISIARDQIAAQAAVDDRLRRFPLGASLGQCCGGVVNLLFEIVAGGPPWLDALLALHRDRVPCVVVSATHASDNEDKLIVTADRAYGPPDLLDAKSLHVVRVLLEERGSARLWRFSEGEGAPLFFLEPILPCDFAIALFGAGHVGRALVRVLGDVRCQVTWVDAREEEFPHDIPANVKVVCTDAPETEVDAAVAGSYFLVMTHSHALDEALVERILRRTDFAYFGLIGSRAKRQQFERRLERRGIPRARFAAMTCPIGMAGIPGKQPATIAIAVAAQLLQAYARRSAEGNVAAPAASAGVHR